MRRRILPLLLIISLTMLPGCWDRTEIDDLGIAIAATIDLTPDNKILFSEQVYIPSPLGMGGDGNPGDTGGTHYHVFSGTGDDIRAAHKDLQKQLSRRLFIADRNLYLISEKVARQGIQPYIDELVRNPESRLRTHIAITKGDAVNYLRIQYPFEQTPGAALRKLVFGKASNYALDLNVMLRMLEKPGHNVSAPIIDLMPASPEAKEAFRIAGMGVIKRGKLIGDIPYDQSKGILWLRDQMKYDVSTTPIPGHHGLVTCLLLRANNDIDVTMKNGHPSMHVKIVAEDDVLENNSDLNLNDPNSVDLLQVVLSRKVKKDIETSLDLLQHKFSTDIVRFGEIVYRAYPKEFNQHMVQHWDDEFARMPVTVEVEKKIRRVGMTGPSLSHESQKFQQNESQK
ncbi:MAG: Ger(x)C family spore germination protein [Tumebacillaceae bacterium]